MNYHTCQWPVAPQVKAVFTTRAGGQSQPPFDGFNLAEHVGDEPLSVKSNRRLLADQLQLTQVRWLHQTHSQNVIAYDNWQPNIEADAIVAKAEQQACAVMTADCLPILLTNHQGDQVAAIHAGWRGLAGGIVANTVKHFSARDSLYAYLCPAISQQAFEVGHEVRDIFINQSAGLADAFKSTQVPGKYFADLYAIARQQLAGLGVKHIFGGDRCTFGEPEHFFSYRRNSPTGRQASLIWIDFS